MRNELPGSMPNLKSCRQLERQVMRRARRRRRMEWWERNWLLVVEALILALWFLAYIAHGGIQPDGP